MDRHRLAGGGHRPPGLGDPEHALDAFRNSLAASAHLNLFASWAAARTALVLVELGRFAEAEPMVEQTSDFGARVR